RIVSITRGKKYFELSNHLGNVQAVVSDKRISVTGGVYEADIVSATDYAPFGMGLVGRSYSSEEYRYGFNGKENDNAISGTGNKLDFGARIYDSRLGIWLSVDPYFNKPHNVPISPYVYVANNPIIFLDPDGKDRIITHTVTYEFGDGESLTLTKTEVIKGEYYKHVGENGKYYYYDTHETTSTFIKVGKGEKYSGSSTQVIGKLRGES